MVPGRVVHAGRQGEARFQYSQDTVDRLWILDVDGHRLLVNQMYEGSDGENPALERMLESVTIQDRIED